jgi:hypothetical protein
MLRIACPNIMLTTLIIIQYRLTNSFVPIGNCIHTSENLLQHHAGVRSQGNLIDYYINNFTVILTGYFYLLFLIPVLNVCI